MTVHELLEKALELAHEGYRSVPEIEDLITKAKHHEGRAEQAEQYAEAYIVARDRFPLDGTEAMRASWWSEQRCVVAARQSARRHRDELAFLYEEAERQWAMGTHKKAAALLRTEARA